jgi:hypothetical protein
MFKTFAISKVAATAVFVLGLVSARTVNASGTVNGNFFQIGPDGNPVCSYIAGQMSGGPSAGADWNQFAVVPGSSICTQVEPFGFLSNKFHVWTNGGDNPAPTVQMGNGFAQDFAPLGCSMASYWYNVVSGSVLGNLVGTAGKFVDFHTTLQPTNGVWKHFSSVAANVSGMAWETLNPAGIIPPAGVFVNPFGWPVEYMVSEVSVNPCAAGFPPIKDLSQYLSVDPYYSLKNPGGPVQQVRITNASSVRVSGPIHLFIEGIAQGRSVVNPDGDYLGSPFVTQASSSLAPGQFEDVSVQFNEDSTGTIPSFRAQVVSGNF